MELSWNLWLWVRFPQVHLWKNLEKSSVYAGLRGSYFFKETGYLIDKLSIIPGTLLLQRI